MKLPLIMTLSICFIFNNVSAASVRIFVRSCTTRAQPIANSKLRAIEARDRMASAAKDLAAHYRAAATVLDIMVHDLCDPTKPIPGNYHKTARELNLAATKFDAKYSAAEIAAKIPGYIEKLP